jgi:hypothetical protein
MRIVGDAPVRAHRPQGATLTHAQGGAAAPPERERPNSTLVGNRAGAAKTSGVARVGDPEKEEGVALHGALDPGPRADVTPCVGDVGASSPPVTGGEEHARVAG